MGSKNVNIQHESFDAAESIVFNVVNNLNRGVCVSNNSCTSPQYREVSCDEEKCVTMKKKYHTKCFYNSSVEKKVVNGLLVRGNKQKQLTKKGVNIKSKVFVSSKNTIPDMQLYTNHDHNQNNTPMSTNDTSTTVTPECKQNVVCSGLVDGGIGVNVNIETHSNDHQGNNLCQGCEGGATSHHRDMVKIFDIASDDKYLNTLLSKQVIKRVLANGDMQCEVFKKWCDQTDFDFGFVLLSEFLLPDNKQQGLGFESPIEQHYALRRQGVPNFLGARSPVLSQLNVEAWQSMLGDYWDTQLLDLLRFGFPLDFNRSCNLECEKKNHASANQFPQDVDAYLTEERSFNAILGPFDDSPIQNCHYSPFMTREKPGSENRRVIIDLSWPRNSSVNAGIDKNSYLNTEFCLTFPTVDHITHKLKKLGRGAHIFKIDISRAFCHIKVDPADYDLLGLYWNGHYLDTCLPFGSRHGTQIFQRVSNAVRYVIRTRGYKNINSTIFVGWAPRVTRETPMTVCTRSSMLWDYLSVLRSSYPQGPKWYA